MRCRIYTTRYGRCNKDVHMSSDTNETPKSILGLPMASTTNHLLKTPISPCGHCQLAWTKE